MLVVFGGLPGSGKTTIARALVARRAACFIRIDVIEQALRETGALAARVGTAGYVVGHALAASNLALQQFVVVDCVNPVPESRAGWRDVARTAGSPILEVEVRCDDPAEHRRRVETRKADIDGLALPDWQAVLERHYVPRTEPCLTLDTARLSPADAVAAIEQRVANILEQ